MSHTLASKCLDKTKDKIRSTYNNKVISDFGTFGGLCRLGEYKDPVLVSSIDGVGTKIKLAVRTKNVVCPHGNIGRDLVNHCVNDILVHGANPLYFLDYFATSKLHPGIFEDLMSGMVDACREVNCPIIGGEFAEMTNFYRDGEYDVAGCITGVVERDRVITGETICNGDILIGLSSSGLHTNGFSVLSSILLNRYDLDHKFPELNTTLEEELLIPHRCYYNLVRKLLDSFDVHGIAHITGGGIVENVRRVIPKTLGFVIEWGSWHQNLIFTAIRNYGFPRPTAELMRETFNLGIGMVLVVRSAQAEEIFAWIKKYWLEGTPYLIGKVTVP